MNDNNDVKNDHRYSWRKRYQRGYGEESASPALKKVLDSRKKRPYAIEPFVTPEKDHEGHEYTTDKEREEFEKDINYNLWKGLV